MYHLVRYKLIRGCFSCQRDELMMTASNDILRLWDQSSRVVHNRFQLGGSTLPIAVRFIDEAESQRFGGHFDREAKVLCLSNEVKTERIPWSGVIFRETLYHALPLTLCTEARHDISSEYARQSLVKAERALWEAAWKRLPSRRIRANLTYTSFDTIEWMISLGGDGELDSLVHEFTSLAKYGRDLAFIDYVEYMNKRTQRIEVGLNHMELRIIDTLLKVPNITISELAQQIEVSKSWASTLLNRLKRRFILIETISTPFSRIGIRTFHIMLGSQPEDDPSRYLTACPFLFSIQPILNGPWQVLARLAVPDNQASIQSLHDMIDILNDNGVAVDLSETHSAALTHSFYHYNVANRQWEIPWVAMHGWGQRIHDEELYDVVERVDIPAKMTDAYLDDVDLQILQLINRKISSSRGLRKELGIGQNHLIRHLAKLRDNGLTRRDCGVYNIGLVERIAIRVSDKRMSRILDAWSRELPKTFLRYGESRDLLMIAELPSGSSARLMETIRELGWHASVSLLGGNIWGQWSFPANLWNVENQAWDSPYESIDVWLTQLADHIDTTPKRVPASEVFSRSK